jgi:hypothetical protein
VSTSCAQLTLALLYVSSIVFILPALHCLYRGLPLDHHHYLLFFAPSMNTPARPGPHPLQLLSISSFFCRFTHSLLLPSFLPSFLHLVRSPYRHLFILTSPTHTHTHSLSLSFFSIIFSHSYSFPKKGVAVHM